MTAPHPTLGPLPPALADLTDEEYAELLGCLVMGCADFLKALPAVDESAEADAA